MADDVGIGVPERATLGRHGHAAEHERPAFDQAVQVVAHADSAHVAPDGCTRARARATSAAVVIFTFAASPADDVHADARLARPAWPRRSPRPTFGPAAIAAPSTSRRKACGVCARKISSRGRVSTITSPATRLTVSLTGTATIAAPCARAPVDRARDDVGGHKRPRRVVHEHDVAIGGHGGKRELHRILPALAAGHQPHPGRAVEPGWRRRQDLRRHRHDDVADVGMRGEGLDRALQQRAAAELQQLLRHRTANTPSAATRRDDGCHAHRWCVCGSGQTAHYIAPDHRDPIGRSGPATS